MHLRHIHDALKAHNRHSQEKNKTLRHKNTLPTISRCIYFMNLKKAVFVQ
jgi:hypothetical protein